MSYLYLDESGNLGYQLQTAGVSRHFVITILEVPDDSAKKAIEKAVERTMKNKIRVFNQYLLNQVEARLSPQIPLDIFHDDSQHNKPIQAVDLFAWGIYRKYEEGDTQWYEVFRSKIVYEQIYPK